jgi:DNA polymerase-4/protein ImuB
LLACLLIEHLPLKVELHRDPRLHGSQVILTRLSGSQRVVLDASPEAGPLSPGMPLSEALSQCSNAVLVESDPTAYRHAFEDVLTAIETIGADVEASDMGIAYVRVAGLELLFGGVDGVLEALLRAVPAHLVPRIGAAESKFAARMAAREAVPGAYGRASGDVASFLAPLPTDLLPVTWGVRSRLEGFGLRTLGQIAELSPGALQAQFGRTGKLVWELAQGIDPQPLVPRTHQELVDASLTFPSPVATIGAIATAAGSLLARAFAQPQMRGRFARVCTLEGAVFRAPTWHKRMVFHEPVGDPQAGAALVKHTLEGHPPPGPLEELRIELSGLTGEAGRQESLFGDVRRQENLMETLRQLRARLGTQPPIYRIHEVEPWSRLPERRQALVPFAP